MQILSTLQLHLARYKQLDKYTLIFYYSLVVTIWRR